MTTTDQNNREAHDSTARAASAELMKNRTSQAAPPVTEAEATTAPAPTLALALQLGTLMAQMLDEPARRLMALVPTWIPLHAHTHGLTIDQVYAQPAAATLVAITGTIERFQRVPESTMRAAFGELTAGLAHMSARLDPAPGAQAGS